MQISLIVLLSYFSFVNIDFIDCKAEITPMFIAEYDEKIYISSREEIFMIDLKSGNCKSLAKFRGEDVKDLIVDMEVNKGNVEVVLGRGVIVEVDINGKKRVINDSYNGGTGILLRCVKTNKYICYTDGKKVIANKNGVWSEIKDMGKYGEIESIKIEKFANNEILFYGSLKKIGNKIGFLVRYKDDKFYDLSDRYKKYSSIYKVMRCRDEYAIVLWKENQDNNLEPYEQIIKREKDNNEYVEEKVPSYLVAYELECYKSKYILYAKECIKDTDLIFFNKSIYESSIVRINNTEGLIKGIVLNDRIFLFSAKWGVAILNWD